GGVAFFDPSGAPPRFHAVPTGEDAASRVNVLLRDREGSLFAGSDGGLFRLDATRGSTFRPVPLGFSGAADASVAVDALLETARGVLVGTPRGLVLTTRDGAPRVVD